MRLGSAGYIHARSKSFSSANGTENLLSTSCSVLAVDIFPFLADWKYRTYFTFLDISHAFKGNTFNLPTIYCDTTGYKTLLELR